jgi:hypothetical protein
MASFTDSVQALSTFNPYVEQQPIEAMRAVGMQKQQQYDAGYQKIQTSIDKVAGLDIMKTEDQQYLQSKLNELGNNLQTVAAGDFSSYQLANSTAGMASRIGNDSKVQAAVGATNRVRRELGIANAAKVSGKSSVQNQWALNKQINDYLSDPTVGASFNGGYTEYIDIDKKLREVAEKVHELDNSIDDPFKRDANGKHIIDGQGRPIVDDAMMSIKTKGKPAEKILNNFYSSLTENDQNQLRIDASYHYRGATLDTFRNDAIRSAHTKKELLNQSIIDMNIALDTNPKITSAERSAIQAKINDTQTMIESGAVEKELAQTLTQINSNTTPEEYEYKLYTQQSLTQLAKDLSYESYTQEFKSNPYAQMNMEKKKLQFSYDNANREQSNFMARLAWDQQQFGMTFAQKERELAQKKAADAGIPPIVAPGRISTDIEKPTMLDLNSEIVGLETNIRQLNAEYAPLLTNSTLNTPAKKQTYLDYLSRTYAEDPSTINRIDDNNIREYLEKRRILDIQKGQKQGLYTATTEATAKFDKDIERILGNERFLPNANQGKGFTAKQLHDFDESVNAAVKTVVNPNSKIIDKRVDDKNSLVSGVGRVYGKDQLVLDEKALLSKYKGTSLYSLAEAIVKRNRNEPLTTNEKTALDAINTVKQKYKPIISDIYNKKAEAQSEFLAARMPEKQTMVGVLSGENKTDMDLVTRLITAKGLESLNGGVDSQELGDFNPDDINKLRSDKNVGYTIEKKYDGSATLHISNGKNTQKVPLNATEFSSYFPNYSRSNPINDIKYAVLSSPNKTTNLKGGSDGSNAVNAYLSGYDVPNLSKTQLAPLVRLDVEGAPANNGSPNDNYQVRMYVNNNGHWVTKILNTKGYVKEGGIQAIIDNIGPNTVGDLLKKQ